MQTVAELPTFVKHAARLLGDTERKDLVDAVAANPLAGVLMPRCGGFRKLRWSRPGTGKSGGVRVIYYFYNENHPVLLTLVYSKNRQDALTGDQENSLAMLANRIKDGWRKE